MELILEVQDDLLVQLKDLYVPLLSLLLLLPPPSSSSLPPSPPPPTPSLPPTFPIPLSIPGLTSGHLCTAWTNTSTSKILRWHRAVP